MENIANNKLIAEFMGLKVVHDSVQHLIEFPDGRLKALHGKYDVSWDWLMPVALKCVEIAENMQADEWVSSIQMSVASYKSTIKSAHKEVVQFINWYNKQK